MDLQLRCNNHVEVYCRKELRGDAFVTTCNHIFCTDCVQKHGFDRTDGDRRRCLACDGPLPKVENVVLANLRPSEEHQYTVLSGLNPILIMECAKRALAFYNYQMTTEIAWLEHLNKECTARYLHLHTDAHRVIEAANADIAALEKKIETLTVTRGDADKHADDIAKLYKEKSKQCQTFEQMYHTLKQEVLGRNGRGPSIPGSESLPAQDYRSPHFPQFSITEKAPYGGKFSLAQNGIEQLHPRQQSGSARAPTSSEPGRGYKSMPPPLRPAVPELLGRIGTSIVPAHLASRDHSSPAVKQPYPLNSHATPVRSYVSHLGRGNRGRKKFATITSTGLGGPTSPTLDHAILI